MEFADVLNYNLMSWVLGMTVYGDVCFASKYVFETDIFFFRSFMCILVPISIYSTFSWIVFF